MTTPMYYGFEEHARPVTIGSEHYVCLRCASVIERSPSGVDAHRRWHEDIAALLARAEEERIRIWEGDTP